MRLHKNVILLRKIRPPSPLSGIRTREMYGNLCEGFSLFSFFPFTASCRLELRRIARFRRHARSDSAVSENARGLARDSL